MAKRIKSSYWLYLLTFVLAAVILLYVSVGDAFARYPQTTRVNTVVQSPNGDVTSDCLVSEGKQIILLGSATKAQFTLEAAQDTTLKIKWTVTAQNTDAKFYIADTELTADSEIELVGGEATVVTVEFVSTGETAVSEQAEVEVICGSLSGTFRTKIIAEEDPEDETDPEEGGESGTEGEGGTTGDSGNTENGGTAGDGGTTGEGGNTETGGEGGSAEGGGNTEAGGEGGSAEGTEPDTGSDTNTDPNAAAGTVTEGTDTTEPEAQTTPTDPTTTDNETDNTENPGNTDNTDNTGNTGNTDNTTTPETPENPVTPEPPTEPEPTVPETEGVVTMKVLSEADVYGYIPMVIAASGEGEITLNLNGEPFPAFTRYSADNGNTWYLLYSAGEIHLEDADTTTLLIDIPAAKLTGIEEISVNAAQGNAKASATVSIINAVLPETALVLTKQYTHLKAENEETEEDTNNTETEEPELELTTVVQFPSSWTVTEYTVEILSEDADGKLVYLPVEIGEATPIQVVIKEIELETQEPENGEPAEGEPTEGETTEGGTTEGGTTEGGTTEGGTTEGGTAEGGTTEGGTAEGGTTEGGTTEEEPAVPVKVQTLSLALGDEYPAAGTYRITCKWSFEGLCFKQTQVVFFVNYSTCSDVYYRGVEQ